MKIKFLGKERGKQDRYGLLITTDDPMTTGVYIVKEGEEVEVSDTAREDL